MSCTTCSPLFLGLVLSSVSGVLIHTLWRYVCWVNCSRGVYLTKSERVVTQPQIKNVLFYCSVINFLLREFWANTCFVIAASHERFVHAERQSSVSISPYCPLDITNCPTSFKMSKCCVWFRLKWNLFSSLFLHRYVLVAWKSHWSWTDSSSDSLN